MGKLAQYSASNLVAEAQVDSGKWNQQPSANEVAQTVENIQRRGIAVILAILVEISARGVLTYIKHLKHSFLPSNCALSTAKVRLFLSLIHISEPTRRTP